MKQKKILNFFIPKKENGIGQWLAEEGISAGFPSPADDFKETRISLDRELVKNKEVLARFEEEISTCNGNFGKWEQIKRFELIPEEWTIDEGHLTPTMKLKRKVVKEKYSDLIEKMYE